MTDSTGVMWTRKGMEQVNTRVIIEFVGGLSVIVLLALIIAHFLGSGFGCFMDEECVKAREELKRLVSDVNKACQESDLNPQEQGAVLGEYDFGASHELDVVDGNTFWLINYKNIEEMDLSAESLMGKSLGKKKSQAIDWQIQMTAEKCDGTFRCGMLRSAKDCQDNIGKIAGDIAGGKQGQYWLFPIEGDSNGTFRYTTPDTDNTIINLKWVASGMEGKSPDEVLGDVWDDLTGGGGSSGQCPSGMTMLGDQNDACSGADEGTFCNVNLGGTCEKNSGDGGQDLVCCVPNGE